MFRRFTDRLTQAMTGTDPEAMRNLTSMGFTTEAAKQALQATNGNADEAAALLLASGGSIQQQAAPPAASTLQHRSMHDILLYGGEADVAERGNDATVRRIMQESLQAEDERRLQEVMMESATEATSGAAPPQQKQKRTAAMSKAAEAAERRAAANDKWGKKTNRNSSNGERKPKTKSSTAAASAKSSAPLQGPLSTRSTTSGLSTHHPDVKIIPKLQDKSKEEQIIRCADRLQKAKNPQAVDTLYRALTAVQNDPENSKFRKIDKTTPGYQRSLANTPGAEDLLHAMNFRSEGTNSLILDHFMVDPALLYLGISALEQTRLTEDYKEAKRKVQFSKTITDLLKQDASSIMDDEARRRAEHARHVPAEPTGGRGALLQVHVAEDTVFRRRFDGDDTLDNVLHWLGSEKSSTFYTNVIETREWCLVDRNRYPIQPLDCQGLRNQTLQYIGCWPSGKLEIMPSSDDWMKHGQLQDDQKRGSSRGLASAPTEAL